MSSRELFQSMIYFCPPLTWYFILPAIINNKAFKSKRLYCSFWNISPRGSDLYWKSQLLIGVLKASAAWLQYRGAFFCNGDFTRSYCAKIPSRFSEVNQPCTFFQHSGSQKWLHFSTACTETVQTTFRLFRNNNTKKRTPTS